MFSLRCQKFPLYTLYRTKEKRDAIIDAMITNNNSLYFQWVTHLAKTQANLPRGPLLFTLYIQQPGKEHHKTKII